MFGNNTPVGRKWFEENANGRLFYHSIFYTLQGEGPFSGEPAVFLRMARCHLNCSFCDTDFEEGKWATAEELVDKIVASLPKGVGNWPRPFLVVITGGEPFLQQVGPLTRMLVDRGMRVQFETVGNQPLPLGMPSVNVSIVVSPKRVGTSHLEPHPSIAASAQLAAIKIPVHATTGHPYNTLPLWLPKYRGVPIYLTPINSYLKSVKGPTASFWQPDVLDHKQNELNHAYAARLCMEHGYRLSLQTHLYAAVP